MGEQNIRETISRLQALDFEGNSSSENLAAIAGAFMQSPFWTTDACEELRDTLIGVLSQLDTDKWSDEYLAEAGLVRLPKDMNGETIHIGDEVCGYGWPDGGVFCQATDGHSILVGRACDCYDRWLLWAPRNCTRAKPKPTIEDVLDELEGMRGTGDYEAVVTRCAELAETLRGLLEVES